MPSAAAVPARPRPRPTLSGRRRLTWLGAAALAAALPFLTSLAPDAQWVLAITLFAMVMWVSETMPLAATGLASSVLLILVAKRDATTVFAAYFDPVVVLLLGGFVLGVALSKHHLDATLAHWIVRRAGTRPSVVLLALMGTTAVFSMWISNTAATAIMIPIALGVLSTGPGTDAPGSRSFVLGIAFSANIGGIGTPIGTTANPIAIRFLADAGHEVTFLGWMARTIPAVALLVFVAWAILIRVYPPGTTALPPPAAPPRLKREQIGLMAIFGATVLLWLTTQFHGISPAIVAMFPVIALFAIGWLDEGDIGKAGWPTLLLIGAGLALGDAFIDAGLHTVFADVVRGVVGDGGRLLAFAVIAAAAIVLTLFSSNTAAAVIMVPMAIQLAEGWQMPVVGLSMLAAVMLSMDFLVPVGTPPNAIAYGTGHVRVSEMLRAGSLISIAALFIVAGLAFALW